MEYQERTLDEPQFTLRAVSREGVVDALRALALLSVCIVNFTFYPIEPLREMPYAPGPWSALESALRMIVAALFEAKGYPLLAFLFAYSFALSLRTHTQTGEHAADARAHRKRRMWRLLWLGVAHGALLFFGDILVAYALCGFWLLRWATLADAALWRRIKWLLAINVVISLVVSISVITQAPESAADMGDTLSGRRGLVSWWALNFEVWLMGTMLMPFFTLPAVMLPMLLGYIAGRNRWLEDAARFAPQWRRVLRWSLIIGLPLNIAYGVGLVLANARGQLWLVLGVMWVGFVLVAAIAAGGALLWHQGTTHRAAAALRWLAPAGRYTLSLYIGLSLMMVLLLSGGGLALGLKLPFSVLLAIALAYWFFAVLIARRASARGSKGLFERWMNRK
jgi:uncharacterized protein